MLGPLPSLLWLLGAAASGDTVAALPHVRALLDATPADSASGWCATVWRRDAAGATVYLDRVIPAASINPACGPDHAAVLVRPSCVFAISEFLELRVLSPYVVLICRPHAQGLPLRTPGAGARKA